MSSPSQANHIDPQKDVKSQFKTRRERLKSALRLKKRKVFEIVKGGPLGLFENPVANYQNPEGEERTLWRQKKSKKSRTVPRKIQRDPIVSPGFVSYVKNGVNEKVKESTEPLHRV